MGPGFGCMDANVVLACHSAFTLGREVRHYLRPVFAASRPDENNPAEKAAGAVDQESCSARFTACSHMGLVNCIDARLISC